MDFFLEGGGVLTIRSYMARLLNDMLTAGLSVRAT